MKPYYRYQPCDFMGNSNNKPH